MKIIFTGRLPAKSELIVLHEIGSIPDNYNMPCRGDYVILPKQSCKYVVVSVTHDFRTSEVVVYLQYYSSDLSTP